MTSELTADLIRHDGPPRDMAMGFRGMAASAHPFATQTAIDTMRRGGNAIDAAVAAAAVLMVVEPRNGHLGGDSFMLFHDAATGRVHALNGSGAAPLAATAEMYRQMGGIPADGLLTTSVPGTLHLWKTAIEAHGTLPFADLLAPAIAYADQGVPVTNRIHQMLTLDAPTYRKFPDSAAVFLPGGDVPAVGDTFRQPALARTLRRLATDGLDAFYTGDIAADLVAYSDTHGGRFSREDFARHQTDRRDPLSITYRGYTVYEQPPVSQGILVLLALNTLQQFDLQQYGPASADTLHLQIEALKLAFEDGVTHLGDPAHVDIPVDYLLSGEHAKAQAARIDPDRARFPEQPDPAHPDTTYMCVADESGTMVSYIHSLFAGAGVVMGDTGALMNSRLQNFSLDPASPNVLAPGKRPVHTLNCYVVQENGQPVLVGGTPGAHWQVQTNLQILVNILEFGMDVQQAIEFPRYTFGDQLSLGSLRLRIENRLGPDTLRALEQKGHDVDPAGPWDVAGAVQLIARDPATGLYRGATEPRRAGCTVLGF